VYIPYSDTTTNGETTANDSSSTTVQFPITLAEYTTKIIVDVDGPTQGTNCSADTGFVAPFIPIAGSPSPAYRICNNTGADAATNPCKFKPDTFVVGVRFDGKVQAGCTSAAGTACTTATDACVNWVLANPTTNQ
jgi:hypothetical protein